MTNTPEEDKSISLNTNSSANAGNGNKDENGRLPGDKVQQPREGSVNDRNECFGDTTLNKGLEKQADKSEE